MRAKFRIILPVVNFVVAATLLLLTYNPRSLNTLREWWEIHICYWINLPASIARGFVMSLWDKLVVANCSVATVNRCYSLTPVVDVSVFLLGVVVVWFMIGLEIDSRGQGKRASVPWHKSLRAATDLLFILFGIFLGLGGVAEWIPASWYSGPKAALVALPYAVWAITIVIAYGLDLRHCLAQKEARGRLQA